MPHTAAPLVKPKVDYGEAGEASLRRFVERITGGTITRMERQVRWRPAWFVDVLKNGQTSHLHLRGDREGDVSIFPDLKREADVMEVLGEHGIQVPRIYGFCDDPPAILMDALPGTRNMAELESDEQRRSVARDYMQAVAAMHRIPVEAFVARGLRLPHTAEDIALAGLHAYLPHYERTRSKPEPLLRFVLGWVKRNVPQHRTRPCFIQFDSGQFLCEHGRITGLYDFEFSMIGDPLVDIATMRMRDSVEPLGDTMPALCRHYEEFFGEKIDDRVVEFHTLLFAMLGTMQFAGTVGALRPGDQHAVYLEFDLALRQVILLSLSTLMGVTLKPEPLPASRIGDNAVLIAKIGDTLASLQTAGKLDDSRKDSVAQLLEWLTRSDAMGAEMRERDLADVSTLLGRRFDDWDAADAALESYVASAGAARDETLLHLFCAMEARRMHLFGSTRIGRAATHVKLPPLR